jgi:hypothetical protein
MRLNVGNIRILAIVAVLALAVAGCGGGSSDSAARTSGCRHLSDSAQKFSTFATGRNSDLETFVEEFHDFAVFSFLTIVSRPPDEIRDDLLVLDDAFLKYVDAVAGLDPGNLDRKALEKLQKPTPWNEIDQQKIRQAAHNITAWVRENC